MTMTRHIYLEKSAAGTTAARPWGNDNVDVPYIAGQFDNGQIDFALAPPRR